MSAPIAKCTKQANSALSFDTKWTVAFLLMRKKVGRENLQQEIEELRAFERESR